MNELRKKDIFVISLTIFSLFFGAGNLIFPPMIGKEAGENLFTTMLFFMITAIILPILSLVSVSRFDGIKNLADKADKNFSMIFTIITSLAVGPLLAMPRTGVVPFEIGIAPYLPLSISKSIGLLIFTVFFFFISFILSLNPGRLSQILGKITSRILIVLIFLLFIGGIVKPMGKYGTPVEKYMKFYGIQGILEGYLTLDVMAGLTYGLVVANIIKSYNIKEENRKKITVKTGIIAGLALFIIYSMLAHIGATSVGIFPHTTNGAEILTAVTRYFYGDFSVVLITLIFMLSCLSVSIGLTTALSQYFTSVVPGISYRWWAAIWTVFSLILANMGLNNIMAYSIPLLMATYPASIVLTLLGLIDNRIGGSRLVYRMTIYSTVIISIINTLDKMGKKIPVITGLVKRLPLYNLNLGWICVALVFFFMGIILKGSFEKGKGSNKNISKG